MVVLRLWELKLHPDAVPMLLDGPLRDRDAVGDTQVRASLGHEGDDLTLARGEPLERVVPVASGDQLLHEAGVDDRTSSGDAVDGLEELGHVGDPALEQIADPL